MIPKNVHHQFLVPHGAKAIEQIKGGLSGAIVYKCQSPQGQLCLRRWPPNKPTSTTLSDIHRAVQVAVDANLDFVPTFRLSRDRALTLQTDGYNWELSTWMPGLADYLKHRTQARLRAAMDAIAQLHSAWAKNSIIGRSPAMGDRAQILSQLLRNQTYFDWTHGTRSEFERHLVERTIYHLRSCGPNILTRLVELQNEPTRLHYAIRDIWSEHVLFTEDSVSGIIDFGALRVDEPATDIARLLGSLEPRSTDDWQSGFDCYQSVHHDSSRERVLTLDKSSCLLSAVHWAQWLVVERRSFDAPRQSLLDRWQGFIERLEDNPWARLDR